MLKTTLWLLWILVRRPKYTGRRFSKHAPGVKKKLNVLEIGCGTGLYFSCLSNISKLIGLDVSPEMIERAGANLNENLSHLKEVTTLISAGIEDFIAPMINLILLPPIYRHIGRILPVLTISLIS